MRLAPLLLLVPVTAAAEPKRASCVAELAAREVSFKPARRAGIANAVQITGPLGGVEYTGVPLVIDCSLAVSLDEVGRYLRALGITGARVASAHSVRNVRGTSVPSKHSYGLAVDIPAFSGRLPLSVERDYELSLGDEVDCVGKPTTDEATALKILQCQLVRSGLFSLVLSPDYDADHRDHFHLEVRPWRDRTELRSPTPAIH